MNNQETVLTFTETTKIRLDIFVLQNCNDQYNFSRNAWIKFIRQHWVLVNQKPQKNSYLLKKGDVITLDWNSILKDYNFDKTKLLTKLYPLDIIYEDESKMLINKPANLPVISNLRHQIDLKTILLKQANLPSELKETAGIVHRLDINTTGLIIVAKSLAALNFYQQQFKEQQVDKFYLTLLHKPFSYNKIVVDVPVKHQFHNYQRMEVNIFGKRAISHFYKLEQNDQFTLALVRILTGRTHQIRVHALHIDHGVVNDPLYVTPNYKNKGLIYLHAHHLSIKNFNAFPADPKQTFIQPLPTSFQEQLKKINFADQKELIQKICQNRY